MPLLLAHLDVHALVEVSLSAVDPAGLRAELEEEGGEEVEDGL